MEASFPRPGEAVYLYCFTLPGLPVPQGPGVDETRPVSVHHFGGLAAVVSPVALQDFTGEAGERNLQDIAWLGPRACRHAAVVVQAMAAGPVYPLAFGGLFSGLEALDLEIGKRRTDIAAVLRQVEGCQEWSVEGTLDRKQAIDRLLAEGLRAGRFSLPEATGRRHLEEQKLRRALVPEVDGWIGQHMAAIQQELAALSRDCRPRRLRDEIILHWACLVAVGQADDFGQAVNAIASGYGHHGLRLRLTGPWPPYSFCQTPKP